MRIILFKSLLADRCSTINLRSVFLRSFILPIVIPVKASWQFYRWDITCCHDPVGIKSIIISGMSGLSKDPLCQNEERSQSSSEWGNTFLPIYHPEGTPNTSNNNKHMRKSPVDKRHTPPINYQLTPSRWTLTLSLPPLG